MRARSPSAFFICPILEDLWYRFPGVVGDQMGTCEQNVRPRANHAVRTGIDRNWHSQAASGLTCQALMMNSNFTLFLRSGVVAVEQEDAPSIHPNSQGGGGATSKDVVTRIVTGLAFFLSCSF